MRAEDQHLCRHRKVSGDDARRKWRCDRCGMEFVPYNFTRTGPSSIAPAMTNAIAGPQIGRGVSR
jgi:hypothetical protein